MKNIQVIAKGESVNYSLQLDQYVFCITITDSWSLAREVPELYHFPHTPNTTAPLEENGTMGSGDDTYN
jgi:hypothetical protein